MVLAFIVRGIRPVPLGGGDEGHWRRRLHEEARRVAEANQPLQYSSEFRVDVTLFIERSVMDAVQEGDLDNLAKPVLDVLFGNPQTAFPECTGGLFPDVHDRQVFELELRKKPVDAPGEQGADIAVWWY